MKSNDNDTKIEIQIDIPPQRPGEIIFPNGKVEILQDVFSEEMKQML